MPEVLIALVGLLTGIASTFSHTLVRERREHQVSVEFERARVAELLQLLEAKAAPAEFAAYVHQTPASDPERWLFTDDGLVGVRVDDE